MHAKITSPGLYPDLPASEYFTSRCPTRPLSNSGIKILISETPADFIGREPADSAAMRLGDVVHQLALGKGQGYEISPWDDYRKKEAQEWRDAVIEAGRTPIKQKDWDAASDMAEIVVKRVHAALGGAEYQTEVPFFWTEETTHGTTWCCAMMDIWCPSLGVVIDPKVTKYIHGDKARAHIANMGWATQNAWYRRGLSRLLPDMHIRFANLMISPDKPHTSRLVEISEGWRAGAELDCERALEIFARCMATNEWPGYPDQEILDEPTWLQNARMIREVMEDEDADTVR